MTDKTDKKKHWADWIALGMSLLSLAIAGTTAYRNVFIQRDDVRFVAGDTLRVGRSENDEFRIDEDQEFTFINSGNRQAVVTEISGTLVLVIDKNVQCANRFAKNIILNANKTVLKPGEIQLLRAKVVKDYPWEKGKEGLYFRETKTSQTYIVCIEFYVTTPDSSSVRLVQPLYELAPGKSALSYSIRKSRSR
jgi:hypothetical protein